MTTDVQQYIGLGAWNDGICILVEGPTGRCRCRRRVTMIGETFSHYKILEKLGEGGMGVVYKARDTKLKRDVAIKFLPAGIASRSEQRERFKLEAQAAAALNHPNIATIYGIEEVNEKVFIIMEYVEGQELRKKIADSAITLNESLDVAQRLASGLQTAHESGIVHRDIKSSNVMMTNSGAVKIMDFGLAKITGTDITETNVIVGTAAYMSPEQASGFGVDHRTDIWAIGVVMYEMLTGELPFKVEHAAAWPQVIKNETPLAPSALDRRIPPDVDGIVLKMLAKSADDRYDSAEEVLASIKDVHEQLRQAERGARTKAIAVVPFNNISPDKDSDYFSDGLTEELIMNLSRLEDIRVVSRTTSMQYKDTKKGVKTIGRELSVRYIVEGSVRRFHEKLRITAQLIDVVNDAQLWAETYKGDLADIFDIQEQVSKQIVDALTLKLTPKEKIVLEKRVTSDPEAFDCYLRAREFLNIRTRKNIDSAIELFQRAVDLDPRFAAAFAGLGEAYATIYRDFDRKETWLDKALETGLKALMYDATLSEAYAALGLAYLGKKEVAESLAATQKAIELDPNNFNAYWILARGYHTSDRDREAVEALEKAVEVNPDFLQAYEDLEMYYERTNDLAKLDQNGKTLLAAYPRYLSERPEDFFRRMAFANSLAKFGRSEEAKVEGQKALESNPSDPIILYYGACLYARLEDKQPAVEMLKNAVANGYENYEWIKRDPDFENIRHEAAYIELMKGK
jgi:serine/threonine protein kinase/Flp pilus assembly protein TadD